MKLINIYRGKASQDIAQGYVFSSIPKPVFDYDTKELVPDMVSFTVFHNGERTGRIKTHSSFKTKGVNILQCSENTYGEHLWYEIIDEISDLTDYQTSQDVGKSLFDTFSVAQPVVTQPIEEATPAE
tara:strand:+ start:360 stop:740 length:381 start_codon:yes stop_codon:yes gene_type:complete